MEAAECIEFLNAAEARLPVDSWRAAGIHVWPLVRARLGSMADASRSTGSPVTRSRLAMIGSATSGWPRWAGAILSDRRHQAPKGRPADVVALGTGVTKVMLDGGWYDWLCEPVLEAFEGLQLRAMQLEWRHEYRTPRHRTGRWIQPLVDRCLARSRLARPPSAELEGHDELLALMEAHGLPSHEAGRSWVSRKALLVRLLAERFRRILEQAGATFGLVVGYSDVAMAFNQACRERGIRSIEVQHGVQGEGHWAYARWAKLPAGGYGLLPSIYWTWSPFEAGVIDGWAKPGSGHGAVAGGNVWLERWRRGDSQIVERHDELVSRLFASAAGKLNVLVTLQTLKTIEHELGRLVDTVGSSPADWRWWVRLHPAMTTAERQRVTRLFARLERRAEIDRSSELPLPALLRQVDAHLTVSSSTVLEAAALSVPSVVLSARALNDFPEQAASGWVVGAISPLEAHECIERQVAGKAELPRPDWTPPPTAELLGLLLAR